MPVLGEGRIVWHFAIEAEPAEPAVCEIQVNLFAQPAFVVNAVAVADHYHPYEQFGKPKPNIARANDAGGSVDASSSVGC
jgi:hypothetical protein